MTRHTALSVRYVEGGPQQPSPLRMRGAIFGASQPVALMLALVLPAIAGGDGNNGFAKAQLGMTLAKVKEMYPKLEPLERSLGAAMVKSPNVGTYVLWKQNAPGLKKPVDVELRFWNDKLWVIVVHFGENSVQEINAALEKQYGKPASLSPPVWRDDKKMVVVTAGQKWYSIADNTLSAEVATTFQKDLERRKGGHGHAHSHSHRSPAEPKK